jgi:hypothetical protein
MRIDCSDPSRRSTASASVAAATGAEIFQVLSAFSSRTVSDPRVSFSPVTSSVLNEKTFLLSSSARSFFSPPRSSTK